MNRPEQEIRNLVSFAMRGTSEQRERVVTRIMRRQDEGVFLGEGTSVWHEAAMEFGTCCNCCDCTAARRPA